MTARARGGTDATATRRRLEESAVAVLLREGISGSSARVVAAEAGVAPGLVFYHYRTVRDLLLAGVEARAAARVLRYRSRLDGVDRLPDLVEAARELHREDVAEGHVAVLVQILAGSATDAELGAALLAVFEPWVALVREVFERIAGTTPLARMVEAEDAAYAVTALFLGLELLSALGDDERGDRLFVAFGDVAGTLDGLLRLSGRMPRRRARDA